MKPNKTREVHRSQQHLSGPILLFGYRHILLHHHYHTRQGAKTVNEEEEEEEEKQEEYDDDEVCFVEFLMPVEHSECPIVAIRYSRGRCRTFAPTP